ncbi:MAG TPA: hypothetical protein VHY35_10420 [Stellaceae bacterium]|jgi:hypothetical protein|nr:hypothetical protein [Stellaceae bacterium]
MSEHIDRILYAPIEAKPNARVIYGPDIEAQMLPGEIMVARLQHVALVVKPPNPLT